MGKCRYCGNSSIIISDSLGYCYDCIRGHWEEVYQEIFKVHENSRVIFGLPPSVPKTENGHTCQLCANMCKIGENSKGFCGIRENKKGRIIGGTKRGNLRFYYDPLPTNCVADWVCPGGTGAGYPKYANRKEAEYGYYNLAVFYQACNFNCLYCQNWTFKYGLRQPNWVSIEELANAALRENVSCICFFGGDPTPQVIHALASVRLALKKKKGQILRICWETNGSVNPKILEKMAQFSLETGGCIKFDLKAWHEPVHKALCGVSNQQTLNNFKWLSGLIDERKEPPLLIASTLLVPGYVDVSEVREIASFIASLNPNIPYSLLGFYPHFFMKDLPTTSISHALRCLEAAKKAGLKRVRIGNQHLLGHSYD